MKELKDLALKTPKELQSLSWEKILGELKEKQKLMYSFTMKLSLWEIKQTHKLKFLRRYIARLKTYSTQKVSN